VPQQIATDLPSGFEFWALPPEEAIAHFRALGVEITSDWRALWSKSERRAFTVAKLTQLDLLEFAYGEVDKAIAEGMSLSEFQERMTDRFEEAGWGEEFSSSRLEAIYRTNLASEYAAGEWEQMQESASERARFGEETFLEFNAVGDSRTRPEHEERSGTVLPIDDPWFLDNSPPLDFSCRCWVTEHSEQSMQRYGLEATARPDFPMVEYEHPHTGETLMAPQGVQAGFGKRNWDVAVHQEYERRLAAAPAAIRKAVGKDRAA
jgi:SPP1 gp7 family putative phage head morphogenesis protein